MSEGAPQMGGFPAMRRGRTLNPFPATTQIVQHPAPITGAA